MLAKKISSHFDIGGVYMLHRGNEPFHQTMTIHIGHQGFCGSYAFRCSIGLKLFLRLTRASGEGNTKFRIFRRWFTTLCGLIEFPRDVTE